MSSDGTSVSKSFHFFELAANGGEGRGKRKIKVVSFFEAILNFLEFGTESGHVFLDALWALFVRDGSFEQFGNLYHLRFFHSTPRNLASADPDDAVCDYVCTLKSFSCASALLITAIV